MENGMIYRRRFIVKLVCIGGIFNTVSCGKKEFTKSSTATSINAIIQSITLESAIELLFNVVTIAIPIGRFFKISYSISSGVLSLDTKITMKKGELSFKLPFTGDRRIESRDLYIQELQKKIDSLNRNLKIVDDDTILLSFRNARDSTIVPVKGNGVPVCFYTNGAYLSQVSNSKQGKLIEIEPRDNFSFVEFGSCSELRDRQNVIVELDPNTSRGRYADFEVLDSETGIWNYIGRPPQVRTATKDGNVRIRLRDASEVIWDGSFDRNDLHPQCRSHRIIITISDQDFPPDAKMECIN